MLPTSVLVCLPKMRSLHCEKRSEDAGHEQVYTDAELQHLSQCAYR